VVSLALRGSPVRFGDEEGRARCSLRGRSIRPALVTVQASVSARRSCAASAWRGLFWARASVRPILWHMDWKLFASTFAAIFLAEIGDKTQLATLSLAAGGSSRWVVFAGSALALVATSALAVLLGEALSRAIPPIWVKRAAGALFIVLGLLFLLGNDEGGGDAPGPGAAASREGAPAS
jgi:putative Ca2+/H+ antiporter (TMEM165/GDT1 family)